MATEFICMTAVESVREAISSKILEKEGISELISR